MKNFGLLFLFLTLLSSCEQQEKPKMAFYYWKTVFTLSENEKATLKENNVEKLYVRYFDLDSDDKTGNPFPKSPIRFTFSPKEFSIVPVVYIKNKVFLNNKVNLTDLSAKVVDFIHQINFKNKINTNEIQIDCDWTIDSKENYLNFIDLIRKNSAMKISATIRLHQIKYFKKTGVPNVDNAVLMYYNMGTIATDSLNSIYDKHLADKYLQSLNKYPLQLNVALPIYSWAIHIHDKKVVGLISKIDVETIEKDTNFVKESHRFYSVKYSNYKAGTFFEKNDKLKIESISKENLFEIATDLKDNLKQNPKEIIFYDLDELNYKHYEKDIFKEIGNRF